MGVGPLDWLLSTHFERQKTGHVRHIALGHHEAGAANELVFVEIVCQIFDVKRTRASSNTASNGVKAEVREMHRTVSGIVRSKKSALRFLAATGMYTLEGKAKPQFR